MSAERAKKAVLALNFALAYFLLFSVHGNYELEYTVLAYLIEYAARSREIIRRAAISPEMFEDDKCRAAFIALMDEETDDRDVLAYKASKPSGINVLRLWVIGLERIPVNLFYLIKCDNF